VNECAVSNGGCSTAPAVACTNTAGSRTCGSCPAGYTGSGVGNCVDINGTPPVLARSCFLRVSVLSALLCVRAESATSNGGCSVNPAVACTNTAGSRTCAGCPSGYTGNGSTSRLSPLSALASLLHKGTAHVQQHTSKNGHFFFDASGAGGLDISASCARRVQGTEVWPRAMVLCSGAIRRGVSPGGMATEGQS
jgi:hypothetical protein